MALGVLVVVALCAVAAGCEGRSDEGAASDVISTEVGVSADPSESNTTLEVASTTTEAPTDTTDMVDVEVEVDGAEGIADMGSGRAAACGIIKEVWMDSGTRMLKTDYVDFLTGDNAVLSAIADGCG